jgi:glycerophosphoryl diester phosphodiesterase
MRSAFLSLLIVIGVTSGVVAPLSSGAYFAPVPHSVAVQLQGQASPLRWVSAHRGDALSAPDNSIRAIRNAAQAGIRLIEVDIRRTADGTLILFHDRYLQQGNFSGLVALIGRRVDSLSDRELQFVHHPGLVHVRIPTYAEALEAIKSCDCALQLDVKSHSTTIIDQLVRLARATGQAHQIVVQCQQLSTLAHIRDRYPDIAVLARARSLTQVSQVSRQLPHIIQIDESWMTPEVIREIHASGAKVLVKTLYAQDQPETWERLFAAGIDILMTDKAIQLAAYVNDPLALAHPD